MEAKRHRRAELSRFAKLLRSDRRRRLDLDGEHADGSATLIDEAPHIFTVIASGAKQPRRRDLSR
jgi:hypothetical protein